MTHGYATQARCFHVKYTHRYILYTHTTMRYRCEILNHGIDGYEVWLHGRNQGRSGVKRNFTENMLQNTPSCAIDKKSGWGVCSNTPKYSVHNNTLSIIFYIKMNIFTNLFLQNILQNAPNCIVFKIFSGEHTPGPGP